MSYLEQVPTDLLRVVEVRHGMLLARDVRDVKDMTAEQRQVHIDHAVRLTARMKDYFGLAVDDRIVSSGIQAYSELDGNGEEIVANGGLTFRPRIHRADGERQLADVLWVDRLHRPGQFSEADLTFAGWIALSNKALGGGWVVHRLSPDAVTPRDRMYAMEQAQETAASQSSVALAA